ncbi:diphosphomevalonate decarboxylase [Streptococcus pneumoniae]|nr:diphosphomevalonate decarboxylase [Streptococcus pneumoniae]
MDREPVTVRSYANIAIIKYWGKKKERTKFVLSQA